MNEEKDSGMQSINFYKDFQFHAEKIKEDFYTFLLNAKNDNKRVGAYGAAAKGNTLLNFAGVKSDLIEFVCDAALSKQKKYLPGSHIPIVSPMFLEKLDTLDYLVIFPWNIASEIVRQVNHIRRLNTKFVVAIPELKIF